MRRDDLGFRDWIAYSAYGEATRTLRSDVNGDGFVDKDDYNGVIRPRRGAAIGTAAYLVEADLDRNGRSQPLTPFTITRLPATRIIPTRLAAPPRMRTPPWP
jgi:hypothetical protein